MTVSCPVPSRVRPFAKTQQATPLLLKLILGRNLAPTHKEYDDAVAGLQVGDPLMDAVATWLMQSPKDNRALFQQALTQGVNSLPDCPPALRALFAEVDRTPPWLDRALMADGLRFIHASGLTALQVMRDLALMGGYLLSGFNQALVMTGALTNGTSQRVAETGKWWMDCTEVGGLERFGGDRRQDSGWTGHAATAWLAPQRADNFASMSSGSLSWQSCERAPRRTASSPNGAASAGAGGSSTDFLPVFLSRNSVQRTRMSASRAEPAVFCRVFAGSPRKILRNRSANVACPRHQRGL